MYKKALRRNKKEIRQRRVELRQKLEGLSLLHWDFHWVPSLWPAFHSLAPQKAPPEVASPVATPVQARKRVAMTPTTIWMKWNP